MPDPEGSVLQPPEREWSFRNKRRDEERAYLQQELTIDGEAALIGLVIRMAKLLSDVGFPFQKLADLITSDEKPQIDWAVAEDLLTTALVLVPRAGAEACAILFGYLPTTEMGRPNAEYVEQVNWLRQCLHLSDIVAVLDAFAAQNDWERLSRPFGMAMRKGMEYGLMAQKVGSSDTSESESKPSVSTPSSPKATAPTAPSAAR